MRESLTIIGCVLIALLTAALVGPWFIDWSANRDLVEARLSKTLGARVTTHGDIELKLLPTPRLVLGGVEMEEAHGVSFRAQRASIELAVTPLLRGEVRFIETSFESPDIQISQAAVSAFIASEGAIGADVQFERVSFTNGRLRVSGPGRVELDVNGLDLDAEAASLSGPFKGVGAFMRHDEKVEFHFSTGVNEGGKLRLKFVSNESAGLPRIDLDGLLIGAPAGVVFEGQSNFSGAEMAGWRTAGPIKADATGMSIDPLELKFGGDEPVLAMSGVAQVSFGAAAQARFTLAARQVDFDQLRSMQSASGRAIAALPARLLGEAGLVSRVGLPLQVALTTPALQLGGETLTDVAVDIGLARDAPASLRFEGAGPGRSHVLLDGNLETGAAARFQGRVDASVRDLPRLSDWIAQAAPDAALRLRALGARGVDIKGDMTVSAAGFSARNLSARIDRSLLSGATAFTRAVGNERARFYAEMKSDALDLDSIPDLTLPGVTLADIDFQFGLEARAVRVARFGDGMIDAGHIRLRVGREGEAIKLETLSLADIGGASFEANGDVSAVAARFDGRLDAQRLSDLAELLRRVAPGAWSEALATRAVALSPARMTFSVEASRTSALDSLRVDRLKIDGAARGSRIEASIRPEAAPGVIDGEFAIESADAPMLVRQLGFESAPIPGVGRGRVAAKLHGSFDAGFDVASEALVAGTRLKFQGRVASAPNKPQVEGEVWVAAADAAPLLRVLTLGLPDFTVAMPLDANARISAADGLTRIAGISGVVVGSKVSGDLAANRDDAAAGRRRFTGALVFDRVSLAALATLVLGPSRLARSGALWSETGFAAGMANAPLVDIDLQAGQFHLMDSMVTRDARFHFALAPDFLQVTDLTARLNEAQLGGRLALRRNGAMAAISGVFDLNNLRLEQRAVSGTLGGRMEFSSTGPSPSALVAGLAGGGSISLKGIELQRVDERAPSRVIFQADSGQLKISENAFIEALQRELDKGVLKPADRSFDATLATGVLRLNETDGVSATLDLRTLGLELRTQLTAAPLPRDWVGAAPQLTAILKGPFAAPIREIEAAAFINALSARAIAREMARIDALEADIRERAFFVRRQRGLAFMRTREREIAAWQGEQARLAAEEERRRAIEAARLERERAERDRRAIEARRREAESARATPGPQPPLQLRVVPGVGVDPSAAGRY